MKKLSFAKSLATLGLAAMCVTTMAACSDSGEAGSQEGYTGGVAATVNGTEIQEDTITEAIEGIRSQMGLTDEQSWGEWLAENDYTPETVRKEIIDSYVDQELVKQGSASMDIKADPSEVDQYVESMRSNYDSDEAWDNALRSVGMTEDEYRQNIELSLVSQQLKTKVAENAEEPKDEDVLSMAQSYLPSYSGAKKSSHILFDASDEATAKEVLAKIKSGELDFAQAATEYSKDTGSSADGGNVGWDKLNNFVSEYTEALADLDKDEVSDLVTSSYGIHIIKCTDIFTAPETLENLSDLPQEFQDSIRAMYTANNESQAYYTWLEEQREAADIQVNDMPEGLPYYVDMEKFPKEDTASDESGITAVDEDDNPVPIEGVTTEGETGEGDGAQPAEGGDAAAPAEGDGADAAQQPAEGDQPAEGAAGATGADAGQQAPAEGDQPADGEGAAEGDQPAASDQPAEGATE